MKITNFRPVTIDENLEGKEVFFITFYGDLWRATVSRQYVDPLIKQIRIVVKKLAPIVGSSAFNECAVCYLQEAIDKNRIFLIEEIEFEQEKKKTNCSECPEYEHCISGEPLAVPCPAERGNNDY